MDAIFFVRLGFVLLCAAGLVLLLRKPGAAARGFQQFFFEPSSPLNLGLLRAAIFFLLFKHAVESPAVWYAGLPEQFRDLPRGWVWLDPLLPFLIRHTQAFVRITIVSCAFAAVGLFTRPAVIIAAVSTLYIFGVPNFYFKIGHGLHIPVLCAFVFAVSPVGDAFSLDRLLGPHRGKRVADSAAYTIPVRFSWLLIGTMYLYPGLWKLWESGDEWIDGTKLRAELFSKWAQLPDFYPSVRLDHATWALVFFGVGTLLFEVGFFFAVFNRTSRVILAFSACAFHIGVGVAMNIWFDMTFPLLLLIDFPGIFELPLLSKLAPKLIPAWRALMRKLTRGKSDEVITIERDGAPAFAIGALLLFGNSVAGLAPVNSWAFSVYPRFEGRVSGDGVQKSSYSIEFALLQKDGSERPLKAQFDPMEDTASVFRVVQAGLKEKKNVGQGRNTPYLALIGRIISENNGNLPAGSVIRMYRFDFPVDPDERRASKRTHSLLAEITL